jgi:transposase-like protein
VSPRACTVCTHPELEAMNQALVEGMPNRRIASHYGVTERAVRNHKAAHLPATLAKAQEAQEVAKADDLLDQVRDLQERALVILNKAEETGELRTALGAIREARGNLELLAKLLGELDERPVNVLISPQWLELRAVIVTALEPHPEARGAILGALEGAGNGGA